MDIRLAWYGTSTFRLTIGHTIIFLDAYLDRVPEAPPIGLGSSDVDRADFVLIGHSHFDHILGAETIALNTGATLVGSYESVRVMTENGVPEDQLMAVSGGEPVQLASGIRVRGVPGLHSCLWARGSRTDSDKCCIGGEGLSHQDRLALRRDVPGGPMVVRSLVSGPVAPLVGMVERLPSSWRPLRAASGGTTRRATGPALHETFAQTSPSLQQPDGEISMGNRSKAPSLSSWPGKPPLAPKTGPVLPP